MHVEAVEADMLRPWTSMRSQEMKPMPIKQKML
jgi:hypothetical protein